MQLELELRWYTDQLGMQEDLVSLEITEWVWLQNWASTTPTLLEIKLTRPKLLLDSSV